MASDSPTGVRLRGATAADGPTIATVHAASIRELGSDAYDERQAEAWLTNVHPERYPLAESGFRSIVAESEQTGELVGFGLIDIEPSDRGDSTGRVKAIFVDPSHTREGIGSAILDALEVTARDADLETLVLTASRNAIGFYEREGYEGCETVALEMDEGVALECLRMRKRFP